MDSIRGKHHEADRNITKILLKHWTHVSARIQDSWTHTNDAVRAYCLTSVSYAMSSAPEIHATNGKDTCHMPCRVPNEPLQVEQHSQHTDLNVRSIPLNSSAMPHVNSSFPANSATQQVWYTIFQQTRQVPVHFRIGYWPEWRGIWVQTRVVVAYTPDAPMFHTCCQHSLLWVTVLNWCYACSETAIIWQDASN